MDDHSAGTWQEILGRLSSDPKAGIGQAVAAVMEAFERGGEPPREVRTLATALLRLQRRVSRLENALEVLLHASGYTLVEPHNKGDEPDGIQA